MHEALLIAQLQLAWNPVPASRMIGSMPGYESSSYFLVLHSGPSGSLGRTGDLHCVPSLEMAAARQDGSRGKGDVQLIRACSRYCRNSLPHPLLAFHVVLSVQDPVKTATTRVVRLRPYLTEPAFHEKSDLSQYSVQLTLENRACLPGSPCAQACRPWYKIQL